MKRLFCLVLAVACAPAFAADAPAARVFDIVPPAGQTVEMVDGYTVLRQQGTRFGAVLGFLPESADNAWVPLAVLNTGREDLDVGTAGLAAKHADGALTVWTPDAVMDDAQRRYDERMAGDDDEARALRGRVRRDEPGANAVEAVSAPRVLLNVPSHGNNSPRRTIPDASARPDGDRRRSDDDSLAGLQLQALEQRLFKDRELDPQQFAGGDVRIDLPPRRADGQPAEFVLTLSFGGETMDVVYRERIGASP